MRRADQTMFMQDSMQIAFALNVEVGELNNPTSILINIEVIG